MNELMTMLGTGIETVETEIVNPTETLIIPTLGSLNIPKHPSYINNSRVNVNSYGTTELSGFKGTSEELIKLIGADFKAQRIPSYRINKDGEYIPVKNNDFLINDQTDEIIGTNISSRYGIIDYSDSIMTYLALIEEIKKHNMDCYPVYGKVWDGGKKMFLQHHVQGNTIMGEPVDSYIALVTSHDKSAGFTIALSVTRLFCQNQLQRMLNGATNKITLKHTSNSRNFVEARAMQMIKAEEEQHKLLNQYCEHLATIKVTDQQIFDALSIMYHLNDMDSQRALNGFQNRAEQMFACMNMPDIGEHRHDLLGAYYGFSDMSQHCEPLRKTAQQTFIERGIEGNIQLGQFADILESIAK